jgi:ATP adenylyltransferase
VCLLNKFPALPHHALLTSRAFEEQETPLGLADFEALWACLAERDALAFYNAGRLAGASERHRHFQLAPPLPSEASAAEAVTPIDAVLDLARFDGPLGSVPALPFLHALARLRDLREMPLREASTALLGLYREAARAFGCERAGRPYNLLVTREWMLFVPRVREKWEGISVNSLGFAGALLVRGDDALERVRAAGPLALLRHVGVSR